MEQSMRLAPQMIQAMEILQLPILALQERIEAEMQSNPVLELSPVVGENQNDGEGGDELPDRGERPLVVKEGGSSSEDFHRLADFEDEYAPWMGEARGGRSIPGERDRKMDAMANAPANEASLGDYLHQQWAFIEAPPAVKQAGTQIINFIDSDGYLHSTLEEVQAAGDPSVTLESLRQALPLVQTLDPPGVGARDLKECLLLQLKVEAAAGADVFLEIDLVKNYLRDIEMNRLPQIAHRTGKTLERIKAAIVNLSRFNPRPGSLVGQRSAPVITPDAVLEVDDQGQMTVSIPSSNLPHLYISKEYRRMVRDKQTDRSAKQFIRQNLRSAQWLLGAIEQRRQTIRRVTEEVFKVQSEFLEKGPEALRPLPMADVAAKVGVHVATVSRAVAGKYVQTPRGIFPIRMFFSGGKANAEGADMAWESIRVRLREIIDAEDKDKPLRDDQIAKVLREQGITIARRTVAKYRDLMEIPPARKRRTF
jgi:RNA polymerase sigma-54 factor